MKKNLNEFILTDTVKEYLNDWDSKLNIIGGPMNTGKTAATAIKIMQYGYDRAIVRDNYRKSHFIIVGKDYDFIESTLYEEMKAWFPEGDLSHKVKPLRIFCNREPVMSGGVSEYGVDIKFTVVSLENLDIDDLQSYNATAVVGVELQMVSELLLMQLYDRTGRYLSRTRPKMLFGDINYPSDDHHFYRMFTMKKNIEGKELDIKKLGWRLHRQPAIFLRSKAGEWHPNPLAEIPSMDLQPDLSYWQDIVDRGNTSEIVRKVQGDFVLIPKGVPVYVDSWSDDFVSNKAIPIKGKTLLFALDPGNIPAMLVGQMSNDGTLIILAEYAPKTAKVITDGIKEDLMPILNTEIVPVIKEDGGAITTWGWRDQADKFDSHSGVDTGLLIRREFGFNIADEITKGQAKRFNKDAHKVGTNSPEHLVRVSSDMLKKGKVLIHPRCVMLISGLKGKYVIDKNGAPDKRVYSHVCNTFQFLCWGVSNNTGFDDGNKAPHIPFNVTQS